MAEESCCCGSAASEAAEVGAAAVPADEAFKAYMKAVMAPGALGAREKRLIALALSVAMRCEPCVAIHTKGAREAGASEGQVAEAAALGAAFGGAPSAMFYSKMKGR